MSKKKYPKLYKRKWLNRDKGSAYIIIDTEVGECDWGTNKGGTYRDAYVEIKDCNRQITLEFYANDEKEDKKSLAKLRGLIEGLEELEAFMKANPLEKPQKAPTSDPGAVEGELLLTKDIEVKVLPATASLRPVK